MQRASDAGAGTRKTSATRDSSAAHPATEAAGHAGASTRSTVRDRDADGRELPYAWAPASTVGTSTAPGRHQRHGAQGQQQCQHRAQHRQAEGERVQPQGRVGPASSGPAVSARAGARCSSAWSVRGGLSGPRLRGIQPVVGGRRGRPARCPGAEGDGPGCRGAGLVGCGGGLWVSRPVRVVRAGGGCALVCSTWCVPVATVVSTDGWAGPFGSSGMAGSFERGDEEQVAP
jgi:hypothetical protein